MSLDRELGKTMHLCCCIFMQLCISPLFLYTFVSHTCVLHGLSIDTALVCQVCIGVPHTS